jgi:Plant mobile domain
MNNIQIDPALITALVERWRPATHTFYMHMGEVTVTLQNVAVLWGLSNNGYPVIRLSDKYWSAELEATNITFKNKKVMKKDST